MKRLLLGAIIALPFGVAFAQSADDLIKRTIGEQFIIIANCTTENASLKAKVAELEGKLKEAGK